MKPILMNINEMSDSREVYESKPNPFFEIFTYTLVAILAISFIWMYFGKIDVVVKSEGMIRPNKQVATVMNTYSGKLASVLADEGSSVQKGDILYIVEHDNLKVEMEYLVEQLGEVEETLDMLGMYKKSIEEGKNCFPNTYSKNEYYVKVESFLANYNLVESDLAFSSKDRVMSLKSISEQLMKLNSILTDMKNLKNSINENKNLFAQSDVGKEYYNRYLKYQSDYETLENQFKNAALEIEQSTTEEGLLNSLEYYTEMLTGLKLIKKSVINGKSLFKTENSYSMQYEEYENRLVDLSVTYQQAKENYEINKELEGLAVSEWDVEQSKMSMENADRAIENYKISFLNTITAKIKEVEKNVEDTSLNKENIITKKTLLAKNRDEKKEALHNFMLQYLVDLDNTISTLEDNISKLEDNKAVLELQIEKTLLDDNGNELSLSKYRNDELLTTMNSINTFESRKKEIQASIDKANLQIDSAIVKATMSGQINSNIELVEGNVIQSGVEVLSIIPDNDSEYKVNIYVSNENIGKISNGMKVKFNVYALPNVEYGYLTGTITNISKDLKVDNSSGSAYYLAEATLDNNILYNSKGEEGILKAGMACQAQMITENKRILVYLLEILNLWMDK